MNEHKIAGLDLKNSLQRVGKPVKQFMGHLSGSTYKGLQGKATQVDEQMGKILNKAKLNPKDGKKLRDLRGEASTLNDAIIGARKSMNKTRGITGGALALSGGGISLANSQKKTAADDSQSVVPPNTFHKGPQTGRVPSMVALLANVGIGAGVGYIGGKALGIGKRVLPTFGAVSGAARTLNDYGYRTDKRSILQRGKDDEIVQNVRKQKYNQLLSNTAAPTAFKTAAVRPLRLDMLEDEIGTYLPDNEEQQYREILNQQQASNPSLMHPVRHGLKGMGIGAGIGAGIVGALSAASGIGLKGSLVSAAGGGLLGGMAGINVAKINRDVDTAEIYEDTARKYYRSHPGFAEAQNAKAEAERKQRFEEQKYYDEQAHKDANRLALLGGSTMIAGTLANAIANRTSTQNINVNKEAGMSIVECLTKAATSCGVASPVSLNAAKANRAKELKAKGYRGGAAANLPGGKLASDATIIEHLTQAASRPVR